MKVGVIISNIPNFLINEKSPYLLQHAYNPVNWFPWGEEAFNKVNKENKPIFLSIGYSTCHWCHVMERESFEDSEVAEVLNENFISIKVDREERPDIDSVYMNVAQRLTGQGGWPLTIFMTPDQKPYFAGTYFPKGRKYNMNGLLEILNIISSKWKKNKHDLLKTGEEITEAVKKLEKDEYKKSDLSKELIIRAKNILEDNFDSEYGGFGNSLKFPTPSNLMFLMRYYLLEKDEAALLIVEKTLSSMYRGGIFDHIGFGFSRYSTDEKWLIPHFEKMLYDNAQLITAYTEIYQITKKELYKNIVYKTVEYIFREMKDENGAFFSAQDADSEGEEGKYYVLTPEEINNVLGSENGKYFKEYFNITKDGNFEHKNIPNLIYNDDYDVKNENIESMIIDVYDYRLKRTKLHKDDKILTSWNCLMISALAKAYKVFDDEKFFCAAEKAIKFIENNMVDDNQNIAVRYRDGSVLFKGTLDDYAMYVYALIEMYEATFDIDYLDKAYLFNKKMIEMFWDDDEGGFFLTSKMGENLIIRPKDAHDGAVISGNSVACQNLIKLAKITGEVYLENYARDQIEFLTNICSEYPSATTFALISLMNVLYPYKEIICILKSEKDKKRIKNILYENLLVNTVVIVAEEKNKKQLSKLITFIDNYNLIKDKTTFYICENNECSLPITDEEEFINKLNVN